MVQLVGKKVLIIEDDKFLGDILLQKLAHEGFKAELSQNGTEGFSKISSLKPDAILLDILLPGMNGYEILEAKVKDLAISGIPTIVISNSGQPVELKRIEALGVKDYLIKAKLDVQEVIAMIKKVLGDTGGEVPGALETRTGNASESKNLSHNGAKGLEGINVVWVEDDKFLGDILSRKMVQQGAQLFHAVDGPQVLEYLAQNIPHIIMLDVMLPGMNGFEILQKIRMDSRLAKVPVIMLSNLGQPGDVEKSKMLGAQKFLVKAALNLDEIIQHINIVLSEVKK